MRMRLQIMAGLVVWLAVGCVGGPTGTTDAAGPDEAHWEVPPGDDGEDPAGPPDAADQGPEAAFLDAPAEDGTETWVPDTPTGDPGDAPGFDPGQDPSLEVPPPDDDGPEDRQWDDGTDGTPEDPATGSDDSREDLEGARDPGPEADQDLPDPDDGTRCTPGSGCPGDPCRSDEDCALGPCVPHLGTGLCSGPCMADKDCPEDLYCDQDPPDMGHPLCRSRTPWACVPPDCDDGLACTEDRCDPATGTCIATLSPGFCLIEGACQPTGLPQPGFQCRRCDPVRSALDWSLDDAGTPCEDGDLCTDDDRCDDQGACRPGPRRTCPGPAPRCEGDVLVTGGAACEAETGECYTFEDREPCPFGCDPDRVSCRPDPCAGVRCQDPPGPCFDPIGVCEAGTCHYTALEAGSPCDDADPCTDADVCDDARTCAGVPRVCDPPSPRCTPEGDLRTFQPGTCDPTSGDCLFPAADLPCDRGCDPLFGRCNQVLIGEFRTRGPGGGFDEYVSIFNAGAAPVDLSGWMLFASNGSGLTGLRATLPPGTVLPPRGAWLLAAAPTGGGGYGGTTPADQTYGTGVADTGGLMLADGSGNPVDQVGMSDGSAYGEGARLDPLFDNRDVAYRRLTSFCGPDRDSGDNRSDFQRIEAPRPPGSRSCPLACSGRSCEAPAPGCLDDWNAVTWTAVCDGTEVCGLDPTPVPCVFGCDARTGACRPTGCEVLCDDQDPCTWDRCDALGNCVHDGLSPCCGNGSREDPEECDDGNRLPGDGCSSDCRFECPVGTVLEQGLCFLPAMGPGETQAEACARIGRAPTHTTVDLRWDEAALIRVAAGLGFTSQGDTGDFSPSMWCDPGTATCHTHAFGTRFVNHGARPDRASLVPVFTCAQAGVPAPVGPPLQVHFLEIGQGDSILLDLGETEVLVDGGPDPLRAANLIAPFVDGPIEAILCTHPHLDHHGGLDEVLRRFDVLEVWVNGGENATAYATFLALAQSEPGVVVRVVDRGDSAFAGDLAFTVLGPPTPRFDDANRDSVVLRTVFGRVSFLFTGDMETPSESSVLATGTPLATTVLKVAHHGSSTSSSQAWLDAVRPSLAVYQAEIGNPYGHPHQVVVDRFAAMGIPLLGTDTRGTIVVTTDGADWNWVTSR